MKFDDAKVIRIRNLLIKAAGKLCWPIPSPPPETISRKDFEEIEDLVEAALKICHTEVGDADFPGEPEE